MDPCRSAYCMKSRRLMKAIMKTIAILLPIGVFISVVGCQPAPQPLTEHQKEAIADTVTQLADDLAAAISSRDASRIANLFADDPYAKYISDGTVIPRDKLEKTLGEFYSGLERLDFTWNRKEVMVLSPDVATMTTWVVYTATPKGGQPTATRAVFTHVYARQDGNWRVVSSHKSTQE